MLDQVAANAGSAAGSAPAFYFEGGEPGILLIHGFLTSPGEMRAMGEYLAARGMTVLGVCLRGHGTRPEDLDGVGWQDWVDDARAGLARLRRKCERVSLVGLSLGAAVALYVAAQEPVERVVACSTPGGTPLQSVIFSLAHLASPVVRFLPKVGSDVRDPVARREHFTYRRIPLRAAAEMRPLLDAVQASLSQVHAPVLFAQAEHDLLVPRHTAADLAGRLGGPSDILYVPRGGHTVVVDYDHERVFRAASQWLLEGGGRSA